jgi:hypothetical protein
MLATHALHANPVPWPFCAPTTFVRMLQRTFREIMFLQELNNHENIIRCVPSAGCMRGSSSSVHMRAPSHPQPCW